MEFQANTVVQPILPFMTAHGEVAISIAQTQNARQMKLQSELTNKVTVYGLVHVCTLHLPCFLPRLLHTE